MASPWDDELIQLHPDAASMPEPPEFIKHVPRRTAWLEFVALRGFQRFLGILPRGPLGLALSGFARLARRVDKRHARAARDFISTAYPDAGPDKIESMVLEAYRHLARVAIESHRLPRVVGSRLGDHFEVEACDGLEELFASDQGCIVLSAHVGFWEGVGMPFHAFGFTHGVAVGKPPNNAYLARWIQQHRQKQGGNLLPRDGAVAGVTAAVRSGGVAFLLLDQRPRQKAIYADLFGRSAACDRSAGVLVRRVGAPPVAMGGYMTGEAGRYRLVFQRISSPRELRDASVEEVVALVNRETEALVRRAPEQYFWLHDRYRDVPE